MRLVYAHSAQHAATRAPAAPNNIALLCLPSPLPASLLEGATLKLLAVCAGGSNTRASVAASIGASAAVGTSATIADGASASGEGVAVALAVAFTGAA